MGVQRRWRKELLLRVVVYSVVVIPLARWQLPMLPLWVLCVIVPLSVLLSCLNTDLIISGFARLRQVSPDCADLNAVKRSASAMPAEAQNSVRNEDIR